MKKHSIISLSRLLMLALLLASVTDNRVSAQDLSSELISYPTKALEQLPAKHRQVVSELTSISDKTAHFVRLNPIKEIVKDNSIMLTLPGETIKTKIVLDKIEYFNADNYLIVGKLDNTPLTAIFSSHNGRKGGLIQGLESTYEIYDLGEEGQLLVKSNNADTERGFCSAEKATGQAPSLPIPVKAGKKSAANARIDPCTSNIRVLFLYTSGISSSTASSFATNTINALNTTISQSGVNNSAAYAEVAGYTSISYSKSTNDIRADALNLSNNGTAKSLRSLYNADLVLLITHETYNGNKGGVPAPEVYFHPNDDRAYAIAALCSGADQVVAAHELSHLYGCNHEDIAYGLSYSKAIIFNSGGSTKSSLVASGPGGQGTTRLLQYSNPYITGMGYLPDKNNTLVVNQNASAVKSFEPEPNVLSAYIDGPYSGIAYHMYTFEAIVSCGSSPYSYQWQVSTDGFNYGSVLGTGEYFNTHLYHNGNHWHYIKLTVTSADNQTRQATRQVWVDDDNGGYRIGVTEVSVNESPEVAFKDGVLYPNPITSLAKVDLELAESGQVNIDVLSISGIKLVSPVSRVMERGKHRLNIPFDKYSLPEGIYLVRIQTPQGTKSHKISYLHDNH